MGLIKRHFDERDGMARLAVAIAALTLAGPAALAQPSARSSAPPPALSSPPSDATVSILPPSFVAPPLVMPPSETGDSRSTPSAALEDLAAQLAKVPDGVVAEVDGTPITVGMVADGVRSLPPMWGSAPSKQVFDFVLNTLVQMRMLALKAKQLGVDKDPVAQRKMAVAMDRELASILIKKITDPQVTDAALQAQYAKEYAGKPGPEEVWLRVIGASSKAAALEALGKLEGGSAFPAVAKEFSRDPSRDAGGDLGYVSAETLPPELRSVAFALPVGQVSAFPLQNNGLWYILEVEGRRQRPAPPLQDVAPLLTEQITFDAARSFILKTREGTDVRVYGPAGSGETQAALPSQK